MIPKKVYVTWKTKNVLQYDCPLINNGIKKFIELNPNWKVHFYDDYDVEIYLQENLSNYDYNLIKNKHIVEKSDLWRLFKIYNEGGMYIDIDRLCNKTLPEVNEKINWILPVCNEFDFSQDIMISDAKNLAFAKAIELNISRRRNGCNVLYSLGAQTYMHAITSHLVNRTIDSGPGSEVFNNLLSTIEKMDNIMLFRESPPMKTLLYDSNMNVTIYEKWKRDFYISCGVNHWTREW